MKFDMHTHSNFSDGKFTPKELIKLAIIKKIDGISITDHDTVDAIPEAINYLKVNNIKEFTLIPGIEFGTNYLNDEIHILGYFIDYKNKKLLNAIENLNKWREDRTIKIVNKLNRDNINITLKEVQAEVEGDFTGRVPIAKVLIKKGYAKSIDEAFDKYIGINKPYYVKKQTYNVRQIINLINDAGGVAILAHPVLLNNPNESIKYCIKHGIDGLEAIHSQHDKYDIKQFKKIAKENNLIITGGSDCHGKADKFEKLLLGNYYIGEKEFNELRLISNERKQENKKKTFS